MGDLVPAKVRPAGTGGKLVKSLVLAACYIALVPVVAAFGLLGAATYFPGPTKSLLGPALRALLPDSAPAETAKADEALVKTAAVEGRLAKLESDIAALVARSATPAPAAGQKPAEAGPVNSEVESQIRTAIAPARKESADRDKLLAAISSLTLARAELLSGNREVAQREVALAQKALGLPGAIPPAAVHSDLSDALAKAADALSRGSASASDWLSLAWHSLADALIAANP